jgi:hypothetical protein
VGWAKKEKIVDVWPELKVLKFQAVSGFTNFILTKIISIKGVIVSRPPIELGSQSCVFSLPPVGIKINV